MPTVSITDHELRSYTHNIVVRYINTRRTHNIDYCTTVDSPSSPDLNDIRGRLYATLGLLGTDTDEYDLMEVRWTDDF